MSNIFSEIPDTLPEEIFTTLLEDKFIRIERIVSKGQTTTDREWYDQKQNEWIILLEGAAILSFPHDEDLPLSKGDFYNIPAHTKHRVKWTDPSRETIWLAIFY